MGQRDADAGEWMRCMRTGNFEGAWRISDRTLWHRNQRDPADLRSLDHNVSSDPTIARKNVLICCHHGLGDTIQFIRYAALVGQRARRVLVQAQPELLQLLGAIEGISQVAALGDTESISDIEVAVEVMELPRLFRTTIDTVPADCPYIHVEPCRWRERRNFDVGLVWKSGDWDERRSVPCSLLRPLGEIPGMTLHVLQDGSGIDERSESFGCDSGSDDILELARIMAGLDLVISVDSMPAHLAGALAVPTWTLLHAECDWRWMKDRSDSPWYPSMRLFRQKQLGDWRPVVAQVANELQRCVANWRRSWRETSEMAMVSA